MGGSAPTQEYSQYRPQDQQRVDQALAGLQAPMQHASQGAMDAAQAYQTNFQQFAPKLNTEFAGPQFTNQLDAFSNQIVAQGQDQNAQKLAAQQAQIGRMLGARSPQVAQILQQQAAANGQMGQNPMLFQAATAQRAREGQEFQLGQQSQALTNASRLAQTQSNADLLGMQNAALGQRATLSAVPASLQQNLLAILSQYAAGNASRVTAPIPDNAPPASQMAPVTNPYSLWKL